MIGTHQMGDARTWLLGIVAAAALLAAACGGGDSVKILEFELEANDGFRFVAELTDDTDLDGETWVLLGHQFTGNRRDWDGLRDELIEAGFTVLTWDFRCHGESPCETDTKGESVFNIWREWHAAIDYAVEQGAPKMYGIGASMGGTSVLQVAADRPELQAVAAVSPADFTFKGLDARTNYDQLTAPKFFIVGRTNASAPDFSRRYHERATGPSRIVVLETDLHGATLVKSEDFGPQVRALLVEYVRDPVAVSALASIDPGPPEPDEETEQAREQQAAASSTQSSSAATQEQPSVARQNQADETPPDRPAPVQTVSLRTDDNLRLVATLWPGGDVWVLLGHQLRESRDDWGGLDDQLQIDGFSVLAWDFRNHGDSPEGDLGGISIDWRAAIDFAQDNGATAIYGLGASMGGTSALVVAAEDSRLNGVVTVSAPAEFAGLDGGAAVTRLRVPLLIIVGAEDSEASAGAAVFSRAATRSGVEHRLLSFPTGLHGNSLIRDPSGGRQIYLQLREFLPEPGS